MTIEQFKEYFSDTICPLIGCEIHKVAFNGDKDVEFTLSNNIRIYVDLNEDRTFNWFISSFGKEFNDIDDSDERLSNEVDATYIGERVNIETLLSFDNVDQKPLFKKAYDYANSIRKCIKCKNWYDKDKYMNIGKYSEEIGRIRERFYNED